MSNKCLSKDIVWLFLKSKRERDYIYVIDKSQKNSEMIIWFEFKIYKRCELKLVREWFELREEN